MSAVERSVARAQVVVAAYRDGLGMWGSNEEVLSDLLADLMHYVDALRVDRELEEEDSGFDTMLATAEMNYTAEANGED